MLRGITIPLRGNTDAPDVEYQANDLKREYQKERGYPRAELRFRLQLPL